RGMQALDVTRHRRDVLLGQVLRDGRHDHRVRVAAPGGAVVPSLQLRLDVVGVLAADVRHAPARIARAIRAVAGHAGRNAAAGIAFAIQLPAGAGELGVGHAGQALLLREVRAYVV